MITSTSNKQMKNLIQLQKKAKCRRDQDVFVVEGIRMFREAPEDWIQTIYASESFCKEHEEVLQGKAYEVLADAVFAHVSDTKTPQGILCVLKQPHYKKEDLYGKMPLLLALEGIQDPGNLGTMFRSGEGAGVTGILMDAQTADLFNPKTIRSTMGSIYRVPFLIVSELKESILQMQTDGISVYAAHLEGSVCYDEPDYRDPSAFLIGNEGNGLTNATAALADQYIRIPMEGQLESLNAAVAASLLMYETNRQRRG